jgi:hypothetical protein
LPPTPRTTISPWSRRIASITSGVGYFYFSNRFTLSTIFERDLMAPKARAERLAHMTDVILGYLAAPHGRAS